MWILYFLYNFTANIIYQLVLDVIGLTVNIFILPLERVNENKSGVSKVSFNILIISRRQDLWKNYRWFNKQLKAMFCLSKERHSGRRKKFYNSRRMFTFKWIRGIGRNMDKICKYFKVKARPVERKLNKPKVNVPW